MNQFMKRLSGMSISRGPVGGSQTTLSRPAVSGSRDLVQEHGVQAVRRAIGALRSWGELTKISKKQLRTTGVRRNAYSMFSN